jgi:drug/metabolite transporter (DMT)-like permease
MISFFSALQYQSAGLASVLITSGPAITILLAHFFLKEEVLTARKGVGVVLALGGAVLLAARGESGLPDVGRASPLGYGLVFLTMFCSSSTTVYARRFMLSFDTFDVASVRMFVAALVVVPLSVLLVGIDLHRANGQGYLALGYAALAVNFGGMLVAFYNIRRFGATAAAMPAYVIPVVGSLGGALFLGEQITSGMLAGMGLIALGLALINQWRRS